MGQTLIVFNKGVAHPRVTGCPAKHRAFVKIEKEMDGVPEPKEVIKDGAGILLQSRLPWPSMLLRTANNLEYTLLAV